MEYKVGIFQDVKLLLSIKKLNDAINRELSMPNGKEVLLNGAKHLSFSLGSVAVAAIIGYVSNDTGLLDLLTKAGVPGFIAVALIPVLHSLIAMLQKKFFPNDTPPAGS